jgi:hypothetical protein
VPVDRRVVWATVLPAALVLAAGLAVFFSRRVDLLGEYAAF